MVVTGSHVTSVVTGRIGVRVRAAACIEVTDRVEAVLRERAEWS